MTEVSREGGNGMRLYVGNLAGDATEECMRDLFQRYGMRACSITKGDRRSFAIVHVDDADAAIAALDGKVIGGAALRVLRAVDRNTQCCSDGYGAKGRK